MNFTKLLPYLLPLIKLLLNILKPTIQKLLEQLWAKVEEEVEKKITNLMMPKADVKRSLFNTGAREIYAAQKIEVSEANLNLVRELVHNKMTKKK